MATLPQLHFTTASGATACEMFSRSTSWKPLIAPALSALSERMLALYVSIVVSAFRAMQVMWLRYSVISNGNMPGRRR
jgi:hypothetical protein